MGTFYTILKLMSGAATFAVIFGGAIRLGPQTFRRVKENPRLFLRTLLVVWVGVPLVTALIVIALRITGQSAALLLLMSVCPGIPVLLGSARVVRGSVATAFLALLLTAATEPILIPYGTRLLSRILPVDLTVQPKHVLDVLIPTVFLPILLGFVVRDAWARLRETLARVSDYVYTIGIVGCLAAILLEGVPLLPRVPLRAVGAAILITIADAILGFWAGSPNRDDQKAISLAAALGNPALALAVVEVSYPEFQAGVMVAVYMLVRGIAMVPVERYLKRL